MESIGKVVDLGKKRLEKRNNGKRDKIAATPEGDIVHPERTLDLTEAEALSVAREAVERYSDEAALLSDFKARHEAVDPYAQSAPRAELSPALMHRSLANQRGYAAASSTESLMRILGIHQADPTHYHGTLILAMSEEFIRRFSAE